APWPVRANSKSAGVVPTVIFSIGIMVAPGWASARVPAQANAPTAMAVMIDRMAGSLFPSMRNHLDMSSAAQRLDGDRLTGRLRSPNARKLIGSSGAPQRRSPLVDRHGFRLRLR